MIAEGKPIMAACKAVGLPYRTMRTWLLRGRNGDPLYQQFWQDYVIADGQAELALYEQWSGHFGKDYRAIRDYMALRWPDKYSLKSVQQVQLSGSVEHNHRLVGQQQQPTTLPYDQTDRVRIASMLSRPALPEPQDQPQDEQPVEATYSVVEAEE
jgi:hypothetical protein